MNGLVLGKYFELCRTRKYYLKHCQASNNTMRRKRDTAFEINTYHYLLPGPVLSKELYLLNCLNVFFIGHFKSLVIDIIIIYYNLQLKYYIQSH